MEQSREIAYNELPPIIEFPKVILFQMPKQKDQDPDRTKSSGSFDAEFDDEMEHDDSLHDARRNIMFKNRIVYNLNNHPRFLSQSIDRVRNRMAFQNQDE